MSMLYNLYKIKNRRVRKIILKIIMKTEGGEFYSKTLRKVFKDYYNVDIGMYTHGGCFVPGSIDRYTTIGRYCSFAGKVRILNRNHPLDYKSTHAFFFNPILNYVKEDSVPYIPLKIGNDVWVGHNAVILPNVKNIGDGAVVGSGAVLSRDLPPYAVAVGNPARIVRFRFPEKIIAELLESKWWEKDIEEIMENPDEYIQAYKDVVEDSFEKK